MATDDKSSVGKRARRPVRKLTALQIGRGCEALAATDPVMGAVIGNFGRCRLRPDNSAPFDLLVSSIISQQLSTKAAAIIGDRVRDLCGDRVLDAARVRRIRDERFRRAGLSRAKIRYIKALASSVQRGELDFAAHPTWSDQAVLQDLVQVPGIGPWTAEMYLMFGLGRPDVVSVGDLGLRKGAQQVYGLEERPGPEELGVLSERWRPWRTIACWYLWRVVD